MQMWCNIVGVCVFVCLKERDIPEIFRKGEILLCNLFFPLEDTANKASNDFLTVQCN